MHVALFNIDPQFAADFKLRKSLYDAAAGFHEITYLEAAFDREAGYSEVYMTFDETVSNKKLKAQLEALEAGCVWVTTFAHNDNNESASAALASVRKLAAKTASAIFIRGDALPDSINRRANEKLAEAEELKQTQEEFDEKTTAVLKMQIAEVGEQCASAAVATNAKIEAVGGDVATINGSVTAIGGDVAAINGSVTAIGGDVANINGTVAALGGNVATICGSMTTFDGKMDAYGSKIDEMAEKVRDNEFLTAKIACLEKQLEVLQFKRHSDGGRKRSDAGRHGDVVHKITVAAAKAAKAAKEAAEAAAKAAAGRELAAYEEIQRLNYAKNKYFDIAYGLDMACKAKDDIIKSKDVIIAGLSREMMTNIYGLRRELASKDVIITGLYREVATNDALTALTNGLKRPRAP